MKVFQRIELPYTIIMHDRELQSVLDNAGVPFGAQWEIYRGLQGKQWTVDDIKFHITELKGSHQPPRNSDTLPKVFYALTRKRPSESNLTLGEIA
jgi:hypothetical protein